MNNKLSRNERQDLTIENWKKARGRGTIVAATGFGKTRIAIKTIIRVRDKNPLTKIIVVVPTDYLKKQWIKEVQEYRLEDVEVVIINTASKQDYVCDMLICDEVHLFVADTFVRVFQKIKYTLLMCLTGTLDRLDGKQVLLEKYAPVCDIIDLEDAVANKWVADFKQYKVMLDVDLEPYNIANSAFMHHFSFFNHDFNLAMSCATDIGARNAYRSLVNCSFREVTAHAMSWLRNMQIRTKFIYDHPKKIEIANKIIEARGDKKIITFTKHVPHAKQICCGEIYHGRMSEAQKEKVMREFNIMDVGVLNSCKALNVGADIQGVNTIIVISGDSSSITKRQQIGRGIRREADKVTEVWQLVIKGTAEEGWYRKSSKDLITYTLTEKQLDELLTKNSYGVDEQEALLFKF